MRKGSKILVKKGSHASAPIRRHGELEAEKIVVKGLKQFGLMDEAGSFSPGRKGDPRKWPWPQWSKRTPVSATNGWQSGWEWAITAR